MSRSALQTFKNALLARTVVARHWEEKRSFGSLTRSLLLAYALLRGRPYDSCEKKCGEGNRPSLTTIAENTRRLGQEVSEEAVKAWLTGSTQTAKEAA